MWKRVSKEAKSPCKKQVVSSASKLIFFFHIAHLNPFNVIVTTNCYSKNFNGKEKQEWWNRATLNILNIEVLNKSNETMFLQILYRLLSNSWCNLSTIPQIVTFLVKYPLKSCCYYCVDLNYLNLLLSAGNVQYLDPKTSFEGSSPNFLAYALAFYDGLWAYDGW